LNIDKFITNKAFFHSKTKGAQGQINDKYKSKGVTGFSTQRKS